MTITHKTGAHHSMFDTRQLIMRLARTDRKIKLFTGMMAIALVTIPATAAISQTTDTSTTVTTVAMSPAAPMMAPAPIDYSSLSDQKLDYLTILRAQDYGLSTDEIADAFALANETPHSFSDVLDRVEDGATFADLAVAWGVPHQDVCSPERNRQHIADYIAAHKGTGYAALRGHDWNVWPTWVNWQAGSATVTDTTVTTGGMVPGNAGATSSTTMTTTDAVPMQPTTGVSTTTTTSTNSAPTLAQ